MRTEDQEFEELEAKIGAETIDLRDETPMWRKRSWFRIKFDYKADDASVCAAWDKAMEEAR